MADVVGLSEISLTQVWSFQAQNTRSDYTVELGPRTPHENDQDIFSNATMDSQPTNAAGFVHLFPHRHASMNTLYDLLRIRMPPPPVSNEHASNFPSSTENLDTTGIDLLECGPPHVADALSDVSSTIRSTLETLEPSRSGEEYNGFANFFSYWRPAEASIPRIVRSEMEMEDWLNAPLPRPTTTELPCTPTESTVMLATDEASLDSPEH